MPEADRLSPHERVLRARLAAHAMHASHDTRVVSKPGRDAFLARFESEVDPDGVLDPAERKRRAGHALKAHMTGLQLKAVRARRLRRAKKGAGHGS